MVVVKTKSDFIVSPSGCTKSGAMLLQEVFVFVEYKKSIKKKQQNEMLKHNNEVVIITRCVHKIFV